MADDGKESSLTEEEVPEWLKLIAREPEREPELNWARFQTLHAKKARETGESNPKGGVASRRLIWLKRHRTGGTPLTAPGEPFGDPAARDPAQRTPEQPRTREPPRGRILEKCGPRSSTRRPRQDRGAGLPGCRRRFQCFLPSPGPAKRLGLHRRERRG